MRKTESQKIALCGVLSALSVVVLLVGNVLQIGTYAAPMLASFLLIPVLEDYGKKYALLLYAVVSLLSLFLVPDKELVLFYVLVLGYYPVLRVRLNNIRRGVLRWMAKFGCFNAASPDILLRSSLLIFLYFHDAQMRILSLFSFFFLSVCSVNQVIAHIQKVQCLRFTD